MALRGKQQPSSDYAGLRCVYAHTLSYVREPTPITKVRLHSRHVWVSEFVYDWLAKCRSGWEHKLGRHIKSSVSCSSGFTRGTTHSLYFPAFQLVYSGTCQPPLHLKSLQHVVSSLPKESLHFSPLGYTACQKHKGGKLPLRCFRRHCVWFWYSVLCGVFVENWQTSGFRFSTCWLCMGTAVDVGWRKTEAEIVWA